MKRSTRISLLVFTICTAIIAFGALWYTRPSTPNYIIEEAKQRQNVPLLEVTEPATRLPSPVIDYDKIVEEVTPKIQTAILNDREFMDAIVVANKENIQKAVQEYTDANLIPILEDKITSIVIDLSDAISDSIKASLVTTIEETIDEKLDNLEIPDSTIDSVVAADYEVKFNKFDEDYELKINALIDSLDARVNNISDDLDVRVNDIEDNIDSKVNSVNENVELRLNALFENLYEEAEIALGSIEVKSYLPEIIDSLTPVVVEEVNKEINAHKEDFVQVVQAESPEISDADLQRIFEEYKYDIVNDVTAVVFDNLEEILGIYSDNGEFDIDVEKSVEEPVVETEKVDLVEEKPVIEEVVKEDVEPTAKAVSETKDETVEIIYPYGVEEIIKAEGNNIFDLFVVHTGDIRGRFEGSSESIGFSRLSTMLEKARSMTNNILLLDAGNIMAGSSVVYNYYGETAGILLDTLNYDAIGVSEKEFNFGLDKLVEASKLANDLSSLKVLSANALNDDEYLYFQPYQVYNYNGFKVAVVALTDVVDVDGINFDSDVIINNAQAAVNEAGRYVDYIIVLGNFGANSAISNQIIEHLYGVDLWIDGYNQNIPSNGKMIGDTLVVQSGINFSDVGVVDILVDDKEVKSENAFLINVSDVDDPMNSALASAYGIISVPEDSSIESFINTKKEDLVIPAPSFSTPKVVESTVPSMKTTIEVMEDTVDVPSAPSITTSVEVMDDTQEDEATTTSISAVIVAQVPEVSEALKDEYTTEEGESISIPVFNATQSQVLNEEDYDNLRDQIREQAIDDALNLIDEE